jgi:hypothetical protein
MISENPGAGLPDSLLFKGKIVSCQKRSLNVSFFSRKYTLGYEFITAYYIYNETDAMIIKIKWGK